MQPINQSIFSTFCICITKNVACIEYNMDNIVHIGIGVRPDPKSH